MSIFGICFILQTDIVAPHKAAAMSTHSSDHVYRDYTPPKTCQPVATILSILSRCNNNSSLLAAASYFMQTCYDLLKHMSQAM